VPTANLSGCGARRLRRISLTRSTHRSFQNAIPHRRMRTSTGRSSSPIRRSSRRSGAAVILSACVFASRGNLTTRPSPWYEIVGVVKTSPTLRTIRARTQCSTVRGPRQYRRDARHRAREQGVHQRTLWAAARTGRLQVTFSIRSVFGRPLRTAIAGSIGALPVRDDCGRGSVSRSAANAVTILPPGCAMEPGLRDTLGAALDVALRQAPTSVNADVRRTLLCLPFRLFPVPPRSSVRFASLCS